MYFDNGELASKLSLDVTALISKATSGTGAHLMYRVSTCIMTNQLKVSGVIEKWLTMVEVAI
jgi:hypothetical protein